MALISISKLMLFLCALVTLVRVTRNREATTIPAGLLTPITVLTILLVFSLSLFWTTGPPQDALGSIAKYGKLLVIVLMVMLIRTREEGLCALLSFFAAQAFLVLSSWLLFFHLPLPWATSNMALTHYAVFSSYLDQGVISAVSGALFWHFRKSVPWRFGKLLATVMALACLANVLFVLVGRTGHLVAIALVSMAIMWEIPRRYRAVAIFLPFLIGALLFFGSSKVGGRLTQAKNELQSYSYQTPTPTTTSTGIRLGLWASSLRSIAEHPVAGSGVGSWSTEYNRVERARNPAHKDTGGNFNPHQEYLLWGVQLGVPGMLLLLLFFASASMDASRMDRPVARGAQSVVAGLAVACFFNSSIYDALIGDFFCVTLGLLIALGIRGRQGVALAEPAPFGSKGLVAT